MEEADGIVGQGSGAVDDVSDDEQLVRLKESYHENDATDDLTKMGGRKQSRSRLYVDWQLNLFKLL